MISGLRLHSRGGPFLPAGVKPAATFQIPVPVAAGFSLRPRPL
jgi:hypothetical protein